MATVQFTSNLKRFFPTLSSTEVEGNTVKKLIDSLDDQYSGIKDYILNEQGSVRKHVNIFISGSLIKDRIHLSDPVRASDEIFVLQALSGG